MFSSLLRHWFPLPDGYVEAGASLDVLSRQYRKCEILFLSALLGFSASPDVSLWWAGTNRKFHRWRVSRRRFSTAHGVNALVCARRSAWSTDCYCAPKSVLSLSFEGTIFGIPSLHESSPRIRPQSGVAAVVSRFLVRNIVGRVAVAALAPVLTQEEIVLYPFCSVSSIHHSYRDVVNLRTAPKCKAPNGDIVENSDMDHVVEFSDGSAWSTRWIWGELSDNEKRRLIAFLSAKSGKQVRQLPVLEDHCSRWAVGCLHAGSPQRPPPTVAALCLAKTGHVSSSTNNTLRRAFSRRWAL